MIRHLFSLIFIVIISSQVIAQKRAMQHEDFDSWRRISRQIISNDGKWVVYQMKPGKGDVTMKITDTRGNEKFTIPRGEGSRFTWDSRFVVAKIKPIQDSVYNLKRKKTKKENLPKDSLAIYDLQNTSIQKIPNVRSYEVPEKWAGYIVYQLEDIKQKKDTLKSDSTKKSKSKKTKGMKVGKKNGYHLVIRNLKTNVQDTLKYVLDYKLAEEGDKMIFNTARQDSTFSAGVYYYDFGSAALTPLCRYKKGKFKQLALDRVGQQVAFLSDLDTTKALIRNFQLRYWKAGMDSALVWAETGSEGIPPSWVVSEHRRLSFSESGKRLYFGSSPNPVVKDTTLLEHEIVQVEVWGYKDDRLHTQQNIELTNDNEQSFLAMMNTDTRQIVQLATQEVPEIDYADKGDSEFGIGISNEGYKKYISWEGFPIRKDVYTVNLKTGEKKLVIRDLRGNAGISPKGEYLYWGNAEDSIWYTYSNKTGKINPVTKGMNVSFVNELNDQPNYPGYYGLAGWTEDDKDMLIYDRYDMWQVSPENSIPPKNLTNGRAEQLRFRYIDLDPEEESINSTEMLLHAFNEVSRQQGYFKLKKNTEPKKLVFDDHRYASRLIKARDAERIIFTKESYSTFPDLLSTEMDFKEMKRLSNANPNQGQYLWGSVELYKWASLDGVPLEGLLYKPENFDPNKKYPMLVYFYERNSHNLNRYWGIVPIRSIINPTFYASRGYIVFVPDIVYRDGYPGESCYNAVVPGVTSLINEGFVDKDKIGAQGHSWGGYQTAYLVTKTNIFAAAESGAPVSNMISAYGGIRWWTGLSRMFQYEHTQSRIGGTLWQYPLRFIENSPIFFMDKVQTPLLIMHNDKDGHVPWYQGIEMFVALRRLNKPAWMLNYNEEPHWPTKWENIRDFNVRMQQFFDHYLKDEPMPKWMDEGVPAILKGVDKGYELTKE